MSNQIDPEHNQRRDFLRVVGPVVCVIGAIFIAIGLWSFFSAFGGGGLPRYFWCVFVGGPVLSIGSAICKYAYMGAVTRYIANEVSPVGKDVVNYMAEGTKGAVREMAAAVGEGLRTRSPAVEARFVPVVQCHKCHAENEELANFCKGCGTPLAKTKPCAGCGEWNDPDARFCNHCGKAVSDLSNGD
jgi:hypothetical protein